MENKKAEKIFPWIKITFWVGLGLLFLALAIFFTWPLAKNFHSAIIGQSDFTDGPFFMWNIWWVKKALLSWQNPFFSNYVYYPANANLTLHTLTFTTAIFALPLTLFCSLITTQNILLFASMVASALGMVWLVWYLTQNKWAGIVSGLIFAFNPYLFSHLQAGHLNLTMLWIFPFLVLFFFKTLREKSYANPIIFALFLVLQSYLDLQLLAFSGVILAPIFFYYCLFDFKKIFNTTTILNLLLATLIYICLFVAPYDAWMKEFWGNLAPGKTYNNGDLKIIFGLNPLNPIIGKSNYDLTLNLIGSYRENVISLGFASMALAALSFAFKKNLKEKIVFLTVGILGVILACGPNFQFNGIVRESIRLPFYYLQNLSTFAIGIVPTRFVVSAYFAVAVLAGFFMDGISGLFKNKYKYVPLIILVFVLSAVGFEYYCGQMKIDKLPVSPILSEIKNDKGDFQVLLFNPGARDGFYQTFFQKRVVGGFLGRRIHDYYLIQYRGKPAIDYLVTGDAGYLAQDDYNANLARKSFSEYGIKYVIVDKTLLPKDRIAKAMDLMAKLGYRVWRQDSILTIYKLY